MSLILLLEFFRPKMFWNRAVSISKNSEKKLILIMLLSKINLRPSSANLKLLKIKMDQKDQKPVRKKSKMI